MSSDSSVWYPLEFVADGSIAPFKLTPNYTLDLPDVQPSPPSPPSPTPLRDKCSAALNKSCAPWASKESCLACAEKNRDTVRRVCTAAEVHSLCSIEIGR